MRWIFVGALCLGMALAMMTPGVAPFVAAGVVIRFLPRMLRAGRLRVLLTRVREHPVGVGIGSATILSVALTLALTLALTARHQANLFSVGLAPRVLELPSRYSATGAYLPAHDRLRFTETIEVANGDVQAAARYVANEQRVRDMRFRQYAPLRRYALPRRYASPRRYAPRLPPDRSLTVREAGTLIRRDVTRDLVSDGWSVALGSIDVSYERRRILPLRHRSFPAQTANLIRVQLPAVATGAWSDSNIKLERKADSQVRITARRHAIGATYPTAEREWQPASKREAITIGLPEPEDDVELDLRSRWAQNWLGDLLIAVSLVGVAKWLILIAIAVANDEVKAALQSLWRRLTGRRSAGT
jgi:hypothetical protein